MVFSSITFLFYFLPIVLLCYYLLPFKNTVLLVASLLFYAWGEPKYVVLMLVTVLVNYVCSLKIDSNNKNSKIYLFVALIFSLSALIIFKYTDFLIDTFNNVLNQNISLINLALPIGISFYTFQTISYTIDVYNKKVPVQKSYWTLLTYVALFPQLIAGPIVRYSDVNEELENRVQSIDMIFDGVVRFSVGLAKKVLIANTLGEVASALDIQTATSVLMYWLAAIAYMLQLYFDFSAYSDMAIGLGKMFGFNFLENFNYPMMATSITDFWRRWHMSLSSFFRDYVYIPLGGNRVSASRWVFNVLVVWSLTGLWHGASWNFVLWGLFFALLLLVEKFLKIDVNHRSIFRSIYVILIVIVSFVIFESQSLSEISTKLLTMFGITTAPLSDTLAMYYLSHYIFIFAIAIIGSTAYPRKIFNNYVSTFSNNSELVVKFTLAVLLIIISVIMIVDANFNPFLYFRF